MEINKIYKGNALEILRSFPSNSIDMVMTSPPYWSLRDYAEGQFIWDNDFDECDHEWGNAIIKKQSGGTEKAKVGNNVDSRIHYKSNFCNRCGAWKGQLGLEPNFELYIKHLCDIFDEIKRILKKTGTCWINLGDTYYGSGTGQDKSMSYGKYVKDGFKSIANALNARDKNYDYPKKSLCLVPHRFAIEMINRKWILRNNIIWHKPNAMPSSIKDRFTVDFEDMFMFSKSGDYYFKQQLESIQGDIDKRGNNRVTYDIKTNGQPHAPSKNAGFLGQNPEGRNKRTVWAINTQPFPGAHFAVYPEELLEIPINAGCPEGGIILDPFFGSGTTGLVSLKNNCKFIGIEPNESYIQIANRRLKPYLTQTKLKGGTNFTKSFADDFPTESLIGVSQNAKNP